MNRKFKVAKVRPSNIPVIDLKKKRICSQKGDLTFEISIESVFQTGYSVMTFGS